MSVAVQCPACQAKFRLADELWRKRVAGRVTSLRCRKCGLGIQLDGTPKVPSAEPRISGGGAARARSEPTPQALPAKPPRPALRVPRPDPATPATVQQDAPACSSPARHEGRADDAHHIERGAPETDVDALSEVRIAEATVNSEPTTTGPDSVPSLRALSVENARSLAAELSEATAPRSSVTRRPGQSGRRAAVVRRGRHKIAGVAVAAVLAALVWRFGPGPVEPDDLAAGAESALAASPGAVEIAPLGSLSVGADDERTPAQAGPAEPPRVSQGHTLEPVVAPVETAESPVDASSAMLGEHPAAVPAPSGHDERRLGFVLDWATAHAEKCHLGGRAVGTVEVHVTFAPNGKVQAVRLEGEPIAGAPVGRCIEGYFGSMLIPAYEGRPFTITRELTLR